MDLQSRIGLKIKELRESKHLSQTQLALSVGYKDKTAIAKVEAGKVDLPQSKILAFSKALNITPADLLDDNMANFEPHTLFNSSNKIQQYYNKLNELGRQEATKRVEELTYISKYTDTQAPVLNAAHELANSSAADKQHDDDIMDNDDEWK